jgi:beta-ketoacyl-acyl-carrier-protein synthase II
MEGSWPALIAGRSGIDWIQSFDASSFPVRIAGEVKGFDPEGLMPAKELKRTDLVTQYTLAAAAEALGSAGLFGNGNGNGNGGRLDGHARDRIGAVIGSCIGGFHELMRQHDVLRERGPDRVSPFFLPNVLVDSPSGQLAIAFGLTGPNMAVVSACATGSHAVAEGTELIRRGEADVILAGGVEACIHPLILAGFCAMRGLAEEEDDPARASRPFDATRAGFVIAEGAAVLTLEELGAARARGATVLAEVLGHGNSNDAFHMAQPEPEATGVVAMIRQALERADVAPERVGYVNAHGTSTPLGDAAETKAIREVFGRHAYELAVSSTKSMTGHMFGGAAALEAIVAVLAIHHEVIPPTINYEHPDPDCDLDYVPNRARQAEIDVALSNSMGLGGHNGCVLFGRLD